MNTLKYKNFIGTVNYSEQDEVFFGKVEGINALVSFEGDSVQSLKQDFEGAVDDYIALCQEQGVEAHKSYNGVLNVRLTPELHRQLAIIAQSSGTTINNVIKGAVSEYAEHALSQ